MADLNRATNGQESGDRPAVTSTRAEQVAFWLLLGYFAVKATYFALRIGERIFPDEISWFGMARVFSRVILLPRDSPESYPLGLITHVPTLYFFLLGKVLAMNILPVSDLILLRLINVGLSLVTVVYAWRLARILALTTAVRILFLVMLTNTVMFTFVAGAVNYDNLATLLAVLSLYSLVRFFQGRAATHGLLACLFSLAGMLTKNVMAPYGLGLLLVALVHERRRLRALPSAVAGWFVARRWPDILLLLCCLVGMTATLALYGGNQLRYGTMAPSMDQVLPLDACLNNRLFVRDYVVRQYQAGQLTMLDAQRLALRIRDPGDRASAWGRLLEAEQAKRLGPPKPIGRWQYSVEWGRMIVARTYSVAAHLSLFKYDSDFYPYYAVFAVAALLWLLRLPALRMPGLAGIGVVTVFYTLILMQGVNYTIYRGSASLGLALTGRYMFPVLTPLYLLTAHGLLHRMPRWWQAVVGLAVALLFILGEFPWFVRQAGPEWYF